jgi:glycosyltransferase involved in cell wall biosynthesis
MSTRQTSVIVCTYNRADLLPNVIERLRAQKYPVEAFEIIIVDNNSNDLTPQVVNSFVAKPGVTIRYIFEDHPGITYARNRGAKEARFPYLAYLDDDCSVEPDWLEQLVNGFDLNDKVVAVGGKVVLDWSHTVRPVWIGSGLESWLGNNNNLGTEPTILSEKLHITECNMALKRDVWLSTGGFFGMDQFGSLHMAAGEILYLLHQINQQGGLVAFIPQAVAIHRMGFYTRKRFLLRGYWQGVSGGMLDYFMFKRTWLSTVGQVFKDAAALLVLLGYACFYYLKFDQANGMFCLVRAARRFSLVLTAMRITGDWKQIRASALTDRQKV